MSILVGTGNAINIQRYRDSVSSLGAFLQQQYSDVANVNNDGSDSACTGAPPSTRGQSNCVILGKYIIPTDNKTLQVETVIGTIPSTSSGTNDISAFIDYKIKTSSMGSDKYDVDWGASMDLASGASVSPPDGFSILILRSPTSGVIRTFVDNNHVINDSLIQTLLTSTAINNDAKICVNSNGLFTGVKMAVYIQKNATSSGGVILLGDNSGCK